MGSAIEAHAWCEHHWHLLVHSDHWEKILGTRLEEMQSSVCLESLPMDVDLLQGFNDELKRWVTILKLIEKKKIRVLTRVYKRENIVR